MAFSRSVSIITIINIVSAMLSIVNVSVMTYFFGTSQSIEVYFASTLMLTTFLTLTNSANISDVVLPIYHKVSHDTSKLAGHNAFGTILNWAMLIALLMIGVIYFCLPFAVRIIVPGFTDEAKLLVEGAMHWVLPLLFFSIVVQFFSTFINAESRFGRPELIALMVKLIALICMLLLARQYDYWALIIGLWVGMAFRISCYLFMMIRLGYHHHFNLYSEFVNLPKVARQFFSSTGYSFSSQAFQVALNAGISQLPQGTFAIFTYVKQLYSKTSGIFLRPIALVFFTKASEIITKGKGDLAVLADKALGLFLLSAAPIIVFMMIHGELFLRALFGEKGITENHLELGATVLLVYFLLLLPSALSQIYSRMLLSAGYAELMYWSNSVMQLLAAAVALVVLPHNGMQGIIIAISFSSLISGIWLGGLVRFKLGRFYFFKLRKLGAWVLVGLFTVILSYFTSEYGQNLVIDSNRLALIAYTAIQTAIFGSAVVGLSWLFGVDEVRWVVSTIRARLKTAVES